MTSVYGPLLFCPLSRDFAQMTEYLIDGVYSALWLESLNQPDKFERLRHERFAGAEDVRLLVFRYFTRSRLPSLTVQLWML